jgi:hypothetical protein
VADIEKLRAELADDPLVPPRGYDTMSDEQRLASLLTKDRTVSREAITSAELYEAIDPAEFVVMDAGEQARVDRILGLGSGIDARPGSQARSEISAIFGGGAGPNTIAALIALVDKLVSRLDELGIGEVHLGDVAAART